MLGGGVIDQRHHALSGTGAAGALAHADVQLAEASQLEICVGDGKAGGIIQRPGTGEEAVWPVLPSSARRAYRRHPVAVCDAQRFAVVG